MGTTPDAVNPPVTLLDADNQPGDKADTTAKPVLEPPERPPGPDAPLIVLPDDLSLVGDHIIVHPSPEAMADILSRVTNRQLTAEAAATMSGYSLRQVSRKIAAFRQNEPSSLIHNGLYINFSPTR
jgi:hypothetical protein